MSVLDQVRKLEQDVVARLKELEPLKHEYEQLRKVAERLGVKYSPKAADPEAAPQRTATRRGGRGTGATKASARTPATTQASRSPSRTQAKKKPARRRGAPASGRERADSSADTTGRGATAARGRTTKRGGARRAAAARPGQRQDEVLAEVRANPGITVREIGERLGVDPTGLYRVVKRLADDGRVRKDGASLHPVEERTASSAPGAEAAGTSPTAPPGGGEPAEAEPVPPGSGSSASTDRTTGATPK